MLKKNNKRHLAAAMALLLCVITLSGCSADVGGTSAGEISDYDSVQFFPVDDNPSETADESKADISDVQAESREPIESREPSESKTPTDYSENVTTQESGFVVSDKMYDFEGNNLVVLNVENKTNKNYYLYIYAQYLDEDGNVLKEETRKFEGFAAGWKNNFFFIPGIPFAKFSYKMETKEYAGKCYGSIFSITYSWERKDDLEHHSYLADLSEWEEDGRVSEPPNYLDYMVDMLILYLKHEYVSEEPIALKESVLFLSSKGEIFRAPDVLYLTEDVGDRTGSHIDEAQRNYICSDKNNAKLVEHFENGDIVVLISIDLAVLDDDSFPLPSDFDNYYNR